jgi:hypothetical protein
MRRRMIALVTVVGVALAVPAAGTADKAGAPNAHSGICVCKGKGQGPKREAPNTKGKKCGFHRHDD